MSVRDLLQKLCPTCGHPAVTIKRDKLATRTCKNGHEWFPVKNPDPRPEPTPDEE